MESRKPRSWGLLPAYDPYLQCNWFKGIALLNCIENADRPPPFERPWPRCCHLYTIRRSGILTWTPFRDWANYSVMTSSLSLGPIDPCLANVDMETFPTSVFNDRHWIIATTTKICTEYLSTQVYTHASMRYPRPSTSCTILVQLLSMSNSLLRHPFSGPIHSAGELLHTP